jgi:hypothetical protein
VDPGVRYLYQDSWFLKPLYQGATAFQEEFRGPVSGSAASKEELKELFHGIGICCRGYKWMGDD